ncbi:MAG: polyvinylalcohol dehydrogenase [Pirellula sp.]|nr:polyvinylalcohol dehydrogenase [Pirellula sp.]
MKFSRNTASIAAASLALITLATLGGWTQAANWAQWRGPDRDGISAEKGLLKRWPAEGPKLAWQADELGDGYSTPAIVGDRIYLLGNEGLEDEYVLCLNAAGGEKIWRTRIGNVGNPDQRPPYPGARSTPTVDGDALYALGSDGDLARLDVKTGEIAWTKNLRTDFGGKPGVWAYSESPLVDGDVVIATPGGDEATIVGLNKATGELVWKSAIPEMEAAYASAVKADLAGRTQYVQFLSKGLVGVDAASGELLWQYDHTAQGSMANIPTPVVDGDFIYSASGKGGGGLVKIVAKGDKFEAEEIYFEPQLPRAIGGSVLIGDHLYGTSSDSLMCVEFATGEVVWRDRSIGAAGVCYADGLLYLHGENGDVALVEATPTEYREVGKFTPPNAPDRGKSKAWAYPVVADGKLYVFDWGTLWCFDVKK